MSRSICTLLSRTGISTFLLAAALGCTAASAIDEKSNSFNWQREIAAGNAIEIKGVNGDIKAEASSGTKVEVTAVKSGRRSDPAKVEIQVVDHAEGVTICAVYPSPDSGRPNECKPGERGRMNTRNNDVEVRFTVRVPAGVRFVGRTVNGNIDANAIPADVEGYTVNGGINISGRGVVQAKTVNGGITAVLGREILGKPLTFETVNGSITVSVPPGLNAELEASTVNGNINTDFPLTVQGRLDHGQIRGTIGSGGQKLNLRTDNGSIHLRRTS